MLSPVSMASVSRVHFGENALDRQGAYAKPVEDAAATAVPEEGKKSSTGKKVAIGAGVVLAVLATLVGLTRGKVLKPLEEAALKETKWYSPKKWGHYLAKAGDAIAKYTYDPIVKLFSKKGDKVAEGAAGAAEGAGEAAGAATSIIA